MQQTVSGAKIEPTILPGQFERWVGKQLSRRMLLCFFGSLICLAAAVVVLWVTWYVIHFTIWFILLSFSPPAVAVSIMTWIVWGLLFVAYATANWPRLEKLEFESPAKLRTARVAAILSDSPFLALTGPKTVGSFVKVVSVIALVGPGMVATAWKLLQMAAAGFRGSPQKVAEVLQRLATTGVRLPLEELIRSDAVEEAARTFAAVRLFDGVIFRSSEPVGLVLTDGLRDQILAQVPLDQRRPMAAVKAPPVKVSAPTKPATARPPRSSNPSMPALTPKTAAPAKPLTGIPKTAARPPAKPNGVTPPSPRPKPRPKPPE